MNIIYLQKFKVITRPWIRHIWGLRVCNMYRLVLGDAAPFR